MLLIVVRSMPWRGGELYNEVRSSKNPVFMVALVAPFGLRTCFL